MCIRAVGQHPPLLARRLRFLEKVMVVGHGFQEQSVLQVERTTVQFPTLHG